MAKNLSGWNRPCLLYTSDAADEEDSVDLGGRRISKTVIDLSLIHISEPTRPY